MRRGLIFLGRVAGLVLLVGAVSATAYAVGHATRKNPDDLEKALVPASQRPQAAGARVRRAAQRHRGSTKHRRAARAARRRASKAASLAKLDRRSVVVAALNATTVSGLAGTAASRLTAAGFAQGTVANDSRTRARTAVLYAPGNRRAALAVAKVVKVRQGAVRAMDPRTRALVGADAEVVVVVGSDRAPASS
jgi:hypothetical protein